MYDAIDDPYTYENSTVLINKLDLRNQGELDDFEAEISNARSGEPLPEGQLDFAHYCAVHHHLFQDVYEWAGVGMYQHVDKKHLDRYLAEFDFRRNTRAKLGINDEQRADMAVKGMAGKRLTYQQLIAKRKPNQGGLGDRRARCA